MLPKLQRVSNHLEVWLGQRFSKRGEAEETMLLKNSSLDDADGTSACAKFCTALIPNKASQMLLDNRLMTPSKSRLCFRCLKLLFRGYFLSSKGISFCHWK